MGMKVITGASLMCPFGTAPSVFNATSQTKVLTEGKPLGTIKDVAANVNIPPFGMCTSMANPQVASATAAALGVLTPQPCMPTAAGTWTPVKPNIIIGGIPCLCSDAQLICMNGGGVIKITNPGCSKSVVS